MMKRILSASMSVIVVAPTLLVTLLIIATPAASADPAYDPSNLISDGIFMNSNSMSPSDIQSFLNAENSGLKSYSDVENCGSIKTPYSYNFYPHCGTSQSAATIIYDAGQAYGLNPQAIIATLQKEQSLITTPNPTASQINCAMGYNSCSGFSGFFSQVDNGAWQFRTYIELMDGRNWWGYTPASYPCRNATGLYSAGLYPGNTVTFANPGGSARTVTLANSSTAALYCYTPYVGPYAQTGYSGSYNFVVNFENWFGSTLSVAPPLPRDAGSPLGLAVNQDGRLQIMGVADNDGIYTNPQPSASSTSWTGWAQVYGALRNVALDTNADGRVEAIGMASNGNIYSNSQVSANSTSWSGWTQMDGGLSDAAIARNSDGTLQIVGVAPNGSIYARRQTSPSTNSWSGWAQINGALKNVALETNSDGRLELVGTASNGNIYYNSQPSPSSTSWSGWTQMDGGLNTIALARNNDGTLQAVGIAANGSIYARRQSTASTDTWTAWAQINGALKNVALEPNTDGRIQAVGIASNGNIYSNSQVSANSTSWSGWTQVYGALRKY